MSRFALVIGLHLRIVNRFRIDMKKAYNNPNLSRTEKYQVTKNVAKVITDKSQAIVEVTGLENLPKEDGYLLCPNHQGRFDGLALMDTFPSTVSFVIDEKRSDVSIESYFIDLTESIRINRSSPRESLKAFIKVSDYLKEGKNVCIYPEGVYGKNKNTLLKFHSGVFHTIKETKKPIVPVCCFDTHKIYHTTLLKKTKCSIHYLKPIEYNEYKDLTKQEIALLVKARIQEKLDELALS